MATASDDNAKRAQEFDAAAIEAIGHSLIRLGNKFEAVAKNCRDLKIQGKLIVDGGKGIYQLIETAINLAARLDAAADRAVSPRMPEEHAAELDQPADTRNGKRRPKR